MKLHEWNARLHGLVIFRSLLSDPVAARFAALIDCLTAGNNSIGSVCNAVAQFESVLFERTTNWGTYLSTTVLETETVCVRQAAAGTLPPVLQTALDNELAFLQQLCSLTLDALLDAAEVRCNGGLFGRKLCGCVHHPYRRAHQRRARRVSGEQGGKSH